MIPLYKTDLVYVFKLQKFILFTDNTTLSYSRTFLTQVLDVVEKELQKMKKWFGINELSLKLDKTNLMIFSNWRKSIDESIHIEGIEICRVKDTKF